MTYNVTKKIPSICDTSRHYHPTLHQIDKEPAEAKASFQERISVNVIKISAKHSRNYYYYCYINAAVNVYDFFSRED